MYDECFILSLIDQENLLNWLLDENAIDWFYIHVTELHQTLINNVCDELRVNKLNNISYYATAGMIDSNQTLLICIGMIADEIPDGTTAEKSIKLK